MGHAHTIPEFSEIELIACVHGCAARRPPNTSEMNDHDPFRFKGSGVGQLANQQQSGRRQGIHPPTNLQRNWCRHPGCLFEMKKANSFQRLTCRDMQQIRRIVGGVNHHRATTPGGSGQWAIRRLLIHSWVLLKKLSILSIDT